MFMALQASQRTIRQCYSCPLLVGDLLCLLGTDLFFLKETYVTTVLATYPVNMMFTCGM